MGGAVAVIAAVPQMLIDIGTIAGVLTAVLVATAALWKTPPVRWFRRQLGESMSEWMTRVIEAVVERLLHPVIAKLDDLSERFEKHRTYVGYHLGPNGETKPVHQRLCDVEQAVGVDPPPPPPVVDWNGPYDDEEGDR